MEAKLLDRGATYLSSAGGKPDEIADARTQAIQFGEKLLEGPPPCLLNNHAIWLTGLHKADEAEALLRKAVDVTRRRDGGNAPSLGVQWANLGAVLKERGEIEEARKYLLRAVTMLDRYPAGAKGATAHSLLGQVLFELGDKPAAAGLFAEAVRAYDAALGPGSLDGITARAFLAQARGEDPNKAYVEYTITSGSIHADEGGLLASSPAWQDDAEQLLWQAISEGERGAAVDLSQLLRKKGRDAEADSTLQAAANAGDPEALYWHARELADAGDPAAESEIRRSIVAGNVFSNYDLGLLLAGDPERRGEAEQAFRAAVDAGYDIARNDLGILLCEWPGREREGEAMLADAGRRGHTRSWANLATYLREHGRNDDAIAAMRAAAEDGYLHAYGTLAYFLEELVASATPWPRFAQGSRQVSSL